ncbi:MAG TPA: rhodanese-like domain-containing protein [Candidatus Merdenecus merdavium]|nr:rhodanese-like domain-containing protein [Candidatus Merdenecus merdavium]
MMKFETISSKELDRYVNDSHAVIIDIRSKEEYNKGHIKNAVNIPGDCLRNSCLICRDKTVILYCERGSSSMILARELSNKGYHVKSVVGGIHAYPGHMIE